MSRDILTRLIASYSTEAADAVRQLSDAVVDTAAEVTSKLQDTANELEGYTAKDVEESVTKITNIFNSFHAPGATPKPAPTNESYRNGFTNGTRVVYVRVTGDVVRGSV